MIAQEVSANLTKVVELLHAASESAREYDSALAGGATALRQTPPRTSISLIIDALVGATQKMEQKNRALEANLAVAKSQVNRLQREVELVRSDSLIDQLTQVGNRQLFDETMKQLIGDKNAHDRLVSLLMIDIDHFKRFNDTYGHRVGDDVLRAVAGKLNRLVRADDIVVRYGGEEFAAILPNQSLSTGKIMGERIRQAMHASDLKVRSSGKSLGKMTVSVGVAQSRAGEGIDQLVERTDQALYAAKRMGRNRVCAEDEVDLAFNGDRIAV